MHVEHEVRDSMRSDVLDEVDTAAYLGMSRAWLRKVRREDRGPAYLRIGRSIRYGVPDLEAWLARHRVETGESRPSTRTP